MAMEMEQGQPAGGCCASPCFIHLKASFDFGEEEISLDAYAKGLLVM